MELCDNCIQVLTNNLSQEAIDTLNKISLFKELSERELTRKLALKHNHVKKLLYELESKLLINYKSYGRTKAYHLTDNGSKLLDLKEKRVVEELGLNKEQEKEVDNQQNNNYSNDDDNDQQVENLEEETNELDNKMKKEEKQEEDNHKKDKSEDENNDPKNQESEDGTENLIWDFE